MFNVDGSDAYSKPLNGPLAEPDSTYDGSYNSSLKMAGLQEEAAPNPKPQNVPKGAEFPAAVAKPFLWAFRWVTV